VRTVQTRDYAERALVRLDPAPQLLAVPAHLGSGTVAVPHAGLSGYLIAKSAAASYADEMLVSGAQTDRDTLIEDATGTALNFSAVLGLGLG
jgi:hypothetical protein